MDHRFSDSIGQRSSVKSEYGREPAPDDSAAVERTSRLLGPCVACLAWQMSCLGRGAGLKPADGLSIRPGKKKKSQHETATFDHGSVVMIAVLHSGCRSRARVNIARRAMAPGRWRRARTGQAASAPFHAATPAAAGRRRHSQSPEAAPPRLSARLGRRGGERAQPASRQRRVDWRRRRCAPKSPPSSSGPASSTAVTTPTLGAMAAMGITLGVMAAMGSAPTPVAITIRGFMAATTALA